MKIKLLFLFVDIFSLQTNAQSFNPSFNILSAKASDTFAGGYTFSYATASNPWNGALISFGGFSNQYDCQISADYDWLKKYNKTEFLWARCQIFCSKK